VGPPRLRFSAFISSPTASVPLVVADVSAFYVLRHHPHHSAAILSPAPRRGVGILSWPPPRASRRHSVVALYFGILSLIIRRLHVGIGHVSLRQKVELDQYVPIRD
jgi:hypothetical protein